MILVVGIESSLAQSIQRLQTAMRAQEPWQFIDSQTLNFAHEAELEKQIQSYQPQVLINCTGLEDVLEAEQNQALAREKNANYVELLSRVCNKLSVRFVGFSTNFVFEGVVKIPVAEQASTAPLSIFGKTKLAGEKSALQFSQSLIIRYSWLYGLEDLGILKDIYEKMKSYQSVNLSDEYVSSPTYADDLVKTLFIFLDQKITGLYHYANQGFVSHFKLATQFIKTYNAKFSTSYNLPTKIDHSLQVNKSLTPTSAILNTQKTQALGIKIPSWESSLNTFIQSQLKA